MDSTKTSARPKEISDLDIIWAIRDIPKSILNVTQKGILSMLIAIIGNRKCCYDSMKQLEDKIGMSERRMRDHFLYLEDINFLTIKRPFHYTNGLANEYSINYDLILSTANQYRQSKCDK